MFISAGHSNTDSGAVGFGRREADIACEFRNMVSFYLQRAKVPHELDGFGTTNMPLNEVVKRSRNHRLSVEFHCNAGPPAATGVEVLCAPKDNATAAKLCTAISTALGIRNRGVKPENAGQHHRLAFVQAGGMIVELFFISNKADLAAYDARKWLAARAVAQVLMDAR
jgi:N-acetylmuramoyl-L-alanine amidase